MPDRRTVRLAEADIDEAVEQSLDDLGQSVRDAWRAARDPLSQQDSWVYDVFPDHAIVKIGEDFWSIPYTRETDGDVEFDREGASKVAKTWTAVEASDWLVSPVTEADATEPDGSVWDVVIIKAGVSKNQRRYKPAVLKKAAPLFEGAKALARSDDDHIHGRNKSVEKIVGWFTNVHYANGAIRGRFNVSEAASSLRTMLLDAWKRGKRDLVGLSIVAEGSGRPVVEKGQRLFETEAITKVSSVDVVFEPAAGGELVRLVAAVDEGGKMFEKLIELLKEADATVVKALLKDKDDSYVSELKEAAQKDSPEVVTKIEEALKAEDPKPEVKTEPAKAEPAKVVEAVKDDVDEDTVPKAISTFVVESALSKTKLPDVVQKRISKRFADTAFKSEDLTEAIKDEIDSWKELEKSNLVKSSGLTRGDVEVVVEEADKGKAALDGFFLNEDVELEGSKVKRFRSFKEAYIRLTGDERLQGFVPERASGLFGISEANGGRFQMRLSEYDEEARYVGLREAISSTTFDQALGDSIRRAMLREYAALNLDTWSPLVDRVPASDFRTNRRVRMGGYGNLPGVAENGPYTALTSPTDEEATYAVTKRGGTETISLETIANDDIGVIRRIPLKLARASAQTLHEFVFEFLNSNAAIYDSVALFHGSHGNLATTAFSVTSLSALRIAMQKQTDMSNSKRLGLTPSHLWVPLELEQTAYELLRTDRKPGTAENDANFVRDMNLDYTVVQYWTDTNNWYATADLSQTPLIELAFYNGEDPQLFTQDNPTQGSMFTNDQLKYKIRHIYGGAVMDYRGFAGQLVA